VRHAFQVLGFAREYDRAVRGGYPMHALAARALVNLAAPRRGQIVLDLGAGSGLVAEQVLQRVPSRLVLMDSSAAMLRLAREHLERPAAEAGVAVDYLLGSARRLAQLVPPESVDVTIASYAFGWLADPAAALREVAAALRPGGRLALDVLPPADAASNFVSDSPIFHAFADRFAALLHAKLGITPGTRRARAVLDEAAYARMAAAAGMTPLARLRVDFSIGPSELDGIWRHGWLFTAASTPALRRAPRREVERLVDAAVAVAKQSAAYRAWLERGEPLRETYAGLLLRKL
jgi:ubiquinone/menaquinone biosynthesis C-methylase UbiE